jgi:sugar phosphate isomerase/epimerase
MTSAHSLRPLAALLLLPLLSPPASARTAAPAAPVSPAATLFARENLLAWCIVPYDRRERSPVERIAMLRDLGLSQYVWDWRERHLATLPEEIRAARAGGVALRGVWLWIDRRNDRPGALGAANRTVIDAIAAAGRPVEWWVGFHANVFESAADAERVATGVAWASYLRTLAAPSGSTVALYNHGDWFGEPENQLRILAAAGTDGLGMVYTFHHGHGQTGRFAALLPRMRPHLRAVVINGMRPEGPKILPVGAGSEEREMLRQLVESGYRGPIGILGHVEEADVADVLRRNLDGLDAIVAGR